MTPSPPYGLQTDAPCLTGCCRCVAWIDSILCAGSDHPGEFEKVGLRPQWTPVRGRGTPTTGLFDSCTANPKQQEPYPPLAWHVSCCTAT
jgi:hypothetical protein